MGALCLWRRGGVVVLADEIDDGGDGVGAGVCDEGGARVEEFAEGGGAG